MHYPGGKGKSYQHLINLMPPHTVYIETHLGGGAVLRHKKPAARSIGIERHARVIDQWREKSADLCELVHGRAEDFLRHFPFTGTELVYADPPYLCSTRRSERVYTFDYSDEEHDRLLDILVRLPCMVILSGYDNDMYSARLKDWNRKSFLAMSHCGMRQETVWFNFQEPTALHDTRHLGSNFRQRQAVKRRTHRMREKLAGMDPIERNALIEWLGETYPSKEVS